MTINPEFNPETDLVLDRLVDVRRHLVWRAWTDPDLLKQWWCPRPWTTPRVELDLRPGGRFLSVMQSPEGEEFPNEGCFLWVEPGTQIAWTSLMSGGFRPTPTQSHDLSFTAIVTMADEEGGTRYRAHVMHCVREARDRHEQMGFHHGWGAALDQLVELARELERAA